MDVSEKYVMQKVNRKEKSICPNCIHHNLCIAENNQPCFECNRFIDANGVTVQDVTDINVGNKWISVKNRLPEEEGWYLVYTTPNREHKSINKAMFCKGYAWGNFEPYWHGAGGNWANVTHWMPLPNPPKEGQ